MTTDHEITAMRQWFESPRFAGLHRLHTPREVAEQRGSIRVDYSVAREAAEAFHARLVAVHAVGMLEGSGFAPATDVLALLVSLGAEPGTVGFAEPGPADQILLRVAAREQADLLVVGTRGLGGSRRALGSTSEAVLAAALVPVVVVPVR